LLSVKNSHTKNTSFGDIYATVDKGVHQFAWRDGKAVVLFLSTVWDGKSTIQKKRKRPAHGTKKEQAPWDTGPIKELPIPTVIDDYNHHMNAVDLADQARATYNRHIREKRTWKPLFNFLLRTALSNAVKLWLDSRAKSKKRSQTLNFRLCVMEKLLSQSQAAPKGLRSSFSSSQGNSQLSSQLACIGPHPMGWKDSRTCTSCQSSGRRQIVKKRQFGEISSSALNSRQPGQPASQPEEPPSRLRRTRHGCKACGVPVCNSSTCWQDHVDR